MWHEFPDNTDVYDMYTQYMVGSGILFAPKVTKPSAILSSVEMQEINFYLPAGNVWYNH